MSKIAKVSLSADVGGFKRQMDQAKKVLGDLGNAKISPQASQQIAAIFSAQTQKKADELKSTISGLTDELRDLASVGQAAWNEKKIIAVSTQLTVLKKNLKEVNELQGQLGLPKGVTGGGGAGGAPAGGGSMFGGMMRGGMGAFGKALGLVGVGLGMKALVSKREQMADERLKITPLTTDNKMGSERSSLGYSPSERRQSQAQIAQQTQVTGKQLDSMVNMAEQLERGYGIDRGTTAEAIGSARRAGVGDQEKYVATAIGTAVAARLDGSKVGEYLSAMSGYLSSMSQGVDIDSASLNGFAGALGSLPFFKNDPSRIFAAIGGMDASFKGGDRFQQSQAAGAILDTPGASGASAAAIEMRRKMGLFANVDKETMGNLKTAGFSDEDLAALGARGGDLVKSKMIKELKATEGGPESSRAKRFGESMGMTEGQSLPIYGKIRAAQEKGQDTTKFMDDMLKEIEDITKDPQKLLADRMKTVDKTFNNVDGSMKDLTAKMESLGETITDSLVDPMIKLSEGIDKLAEAMLGKNAMGGMGGDALSLATFGVGLAAAIGSLGSLGAMLSGVGSIAGKVSGVLGGLFGGAAAGAAGAGGVAAGGVAAGGVAAGGVAAASGWATAGAAAGTATKFAGRAAGPVGLAYSALSADGTGPEEFTDQKIFESPEKTKQFDSLKTDKERNAYQSGTPYDQIMASRNAGDLMKKDPDTLKKLMNTSTMGNVIPINSAAMTAAGMPTDRMPGSSASASSATSVASPSVEFPSAVVGDNTSAIRELTNAIKTKNGTPSGSKMPSNSSVYSGNRSAVGK